MVRGRKVLPKEPCGAESLIKRGGSGAYGTIRGFNGTLMGPNLGGRDSALRPRGQGRDGKLSAGGTSGVGGM